jgi:type II secretion system protein G
MRRGFTLIELLIVVAIIGIIVAIAIPNLMSAVQRARQKRTMVDIKSIASSWETYYVDYSYYFHSGGCAANPGGAALTTQVPQAALLTLLKPTYITELPTKDGWGNYIYFYRDNNSSAQEYKIESWGNDLTTDTYCGQTSRFANDIVLSNGQFIEWPEGPQQVRWNG